MCVIAVCISKLPTLDELKQMESTNRDGGSLAWVDPTDNRVHWIKGRKAKKLHELALLAPLPVVFHFRIATVGGNSKLLCHPFPITPDAELFEAGHAGRVLFHNGHQYNWEVWGRIAGVKLKGPVSDTRMLAAITGRNNDPEWLKEATGSFAIMDKDAVVRLGNFTEQEGIFYSNLHWKRTAYSGSSSGWSDSDWEGTEYGHARYSRTGFHSGTMAGRNDTPPLKNANGHQLSCRCSLCLKEWAEKHPRNVVHIPRMGTGGKPNANHPVGCTCLDCRIDDLGRKTHSHTAQCACHDCELFIQLIKVRTDLNKERRDAVLYGKHEADCECHFCREERKAQPVSVVVKKETDTLLTHPIDCHCDSCSAALKQLETEASVEVHANGRMTALTHKPDCACRYCLEMNGETDSSQWLTCTGHKDKCRCSECVYLNQEDLADIDQPERLDEPTASHGEGCRCMDCRNAINALILADQEQALQAQAEQHMATEGGNGEQVAPPGKGTTLE